MSVDKRAKEYGAVWSDWALGEVLGYGSGGNTAVYQLTRVNRDFVEEDVLKIVNIIEENLGLEEMSEEFRQEYKVREAEATRRAETEVALMHKLRNYSNIVTYQDFKFYSYRGEHLSAVDLLIRMHKYTDLSSIIKKRSLSEKEVLKVGIDICKALEGCKQEGIIHRDIKPENIFFNNNQYLLGDFGISKIVEYGNMAQTSKGTPPYAAPEQFDSLRPEAGYDHRVDIYSLGLTLYVLANKGKFPFIEQYHSLDSALAMRLAGNQIPPIKGISSALNEVILKACEYSPENRYSTAREMREALQKAEKNLSEAVNTGTKAEKAKKKSDFEDEYITEPVLHVPNQAEMYATESAMHLPNQAEMYETEQVMHLSKQEEAYATEPVMYLPKQEEAYATEPAMHLPKQEEAYATEPAMHLPKQEEAYATEPAMHLPKREERIAESAIREECVAEIQKADKTEKDAVKKSDDVSEQDETNYREKAIKAIQAKNNETALKIIDKLIEMGEWNAIYDLVTEVYPNEKAIINDAANAVFWYKKCIEKCKDSWTISLAEYQLGEIFAKGLGVKKDWKMAEMYFSSSVAKGNPYAKKKFVAGKLVRK